MTSCSLELTLVYHTFLVLLYWRLEADWVSLPVRLNLCLDSVLTVNVLLLCYLVDDWLNICKFVYEFLTILVRWWVIRDYLHARIASSSSYNIINSADCSLSFCLVLYQLSSTDQMGTNGWNWADGSNFPMITTVDLANYVNVDLIALISKLFTIVSACWTLQLCLYGSDNSDIQIFNIVFRTGPCYLSQCGLDSSDIQIIHYCVSRLDLATVSMWVW